MSGSDAPYADLDPDRILAAIESIGLCADGRVLALNSYENRVYRIGLEPPAAGAIAAAAEAAVPEVGSPVIAKFYRPGRWSDAAILEEHAYADELLAADLPFVPPLRVHGRTLHRHGEFRFTLFPLRGGHAPEPGDRDVLRHLGRVLGRMHAVGDARAFAHRGTLDVDTHGHDPVDYLLEHAWLPGDIEGNFETLADALLEAI